MDREGRIDTNAGSTSKKSRPTHRTKVVFIGTITLLAISTIYTLKLWQETTSTIIPASIARQALFPLYIPGKLPKGYVVQKSSFTIQNGVVVYAAINSHGEHIAITEEATPQGFNFTNFYQTDLQSPKSIIGTPYPTVIGMFQDTDRLMSILTPNTWILINSPGAHASENDLSDIAFHIKIQR